MPAVLLTNDDGADSPALEPFIRAMQALGEVRVVVPERERSWIGKAISRFGEVRVRTAERAGLAIHVVDGTPADCVSIGVHGLFGGPPDVVVSGINLGLNFGTAFFLSSGTVGASLESWIAGVPSIAFSMAIHDDAYGLSGEDRSVLLGEGSVGAAATAREVTATLLDGGFPASVDLFSVNMPADVTPATARRVTGVTRCRYGPIFSRTAKGDYIHRFQRYEPLEDDPRGDVAVVRAGMVSIAPIRLDLGTSVSGELRHALEGGGRDRSGDRE